MRGLRFALAILVASAIPLLAATPAHAALVGKDCEASGPLKSTGKIYNPKTVNKVTLPLKDDVAWKGSVKSPAGRRNIAGAVKVKLPWPLPRVTIGSWGKPSDSHENSGVYHYDFPSVMGGFDIPLYGAHSEPGVVCTGLVTVHFKGGGFGNPALIGTFVLLIISGVGLFIAFRPKVGP